MNTTSVVYLRFPQPQLRFPMVSRFNVVTTNRYRLGNRNCIPTQRIFLSDQVIRYGYYNWTTCSKLFKETYVQPTLFSMRVTYYNTVTSLVLKHMNEEYFSMFHKILCNYNENNFWMPRSLFTLKIQYPVMGIFYDRNQNWYINYMRNK